MNGAAARLVHPGDRIIVMAYAEVDEEELAGRQDSRAEHQRDEEQGGTAGAMRQGPDDPQRRRLGVAVVDRLLEHLDWSNQ